MLRVFLISLLLVSAPALALTSTDKPAIFKRVGYDQNVGGQLPLDARFRDAEGRPVRLGRFFGDRPVLLVFSYFGCTNLCPAVLSGVTQLMNAVPLTAGEDFELVVISINPHDKPALARENRDGYARRYKKGKGSRGWHFLTGEKADIKKAADAAGFRYAWAPERKQYAHTAGLIIATPKGRLSRYFLGVKYPAGDVRLALLDAGGGRIGSVVDQLVLYCFQYNPQTGRYGVVIMNVLRLGGAVTVLALAGSMLFMQLRQRRKERDRGENDG